MLRKIISVVKIIRPVNFLITFFSIIVACLICSNGFYSRITVLIAAFSGALVAAAGNIINDIFDIEIDRINRPERALPSGLIKDKNAIILYLVLNVAAISLGSMLNPSAFFIVIFSAFIVFIYSWQLKRIPLLGNFVVAFMTALTFIFGGVVVGNWISAFFPALFALLINFTREVLKDIEDIEGDSRNNVLTFPAKYGINCAIKLITVQISFLFACTFIPFVLNYYKIEYFIITMVCVNVAFVYFLKSLIYDQSRKNLRRLSSLLKLNMILGLLSIYFGK